MLTDKVEGGLDGFQQPTWFDGKAAITGTNADTAMRDAVGLLTNYREDLPKVLKVCQAYPDLTDPPSPGPDALQHPVEVCKMAAMGAEPLIKNAHHHMLLHTVEINNNGTIAAIKQVMAVNDVKQQVTDDLQMLAFDHDGWVKTKDAFYKKSFAENGEAVPTGIYASIEAMVPDLKAFIDKEGSTKAFEMPPYHDAGAEQLVVAKTTAQRKGTQVLKIGSDYTTWAAYDEKTWVKSDSTYDYYRVSKGKDQ